MSKRREQLEHIVDLSLAMLEKGRAAEWSAVALLQAERERAIVECFTIPPAHAEAELISPALERILALDAELLEIGAGAHRQLLADLGRRELGQRAQGAYAQVAGR